MEAIAYCRVSTQEQGRKKNGLEAQEEAIIRFAECNGIVLLDCRVEVASGKLGLEQRPILKGCIEDARGKFLLTAKLDRLSRNVEFVSTMVNSLMRQKTRYVPCDLGLDVDPFMLHIYAAVAEKEREMIAARTKAGLAQVKAKGKALGYANHKDGGVKFHAARQAGRETLSRQANSYAETMRPIIEPMRLSGMTYEAIAERLNAYQTPTARGGKWSIVSVRNLVMRWD